ncbi:MAG: peptidase T, partial [Clostridia bacterium]|nr:peptidase T [Clostridia bacterium]
MVEYIKAHNDFKHGDIYVVFTPDEEIGRGTDNFDFDLCKADFGYTVDGGSIGELEYENFNAASLTCEVFGKTIHPGDAKNKMKNAIRILNEFDKMLPENMRPEYTENYEGFYHLHTMTGSVEYAKADYLIREHDKKLFENKKQLATKVGEYLNEKYGKDTVKVTIKDSYFNMREIIEKHFHLIENAKLAMENLDIKPNIVPIRGGTDGARLSFNNLPCANLSTGGQNYHSRFEFAILEDMEKISSLLLEIIRIYTEK